MARSLADVMIIKPKAKQIKQRLIRWRASLVCIYLALL
jgi:hypothetical protein